MCIKSIFALCVCVCCDIRTNTSECGWTVHANPLIRSFIYWIGWMCFQLVQIRFPFTATSTSSLSMFFFFFARDRDERVSCRVVDKWKKQEPKTQNPVETAKSTSNTRWMEAIGWCAILFCFLFVFILPFVYEPVRLSEQYIVGWALAALCRC